MTVAIVKRTESKTVEIVKKIVMTIVKICEIVKTVDRTIEMTDKMADKIIVTIDEIEENKKSFYNKLRKKMLYLIDIK